MSFHRWVRRSAVIGLVAGTVLLGYPLQASAHGRGSPILDAAHYRTTLRAVTPATVGISASVDPRGEWIEVTNRSSPIVTIEGYAGEPYLRVGPTGSWQNLSSPSVALNQSMFADVDSAGGRLAPPRWRMVSVAPIARWHDHRIHWMGSERPPDVKAHPDRDQLIGAWTVHMEVGKFRLTVTGTVVWLAVLPHRGLSTRAKLLLAADSTLFILAAGAAAAFTVRHRRNELSGTFEIDELPTRPAHAIGPARLSVTNVADG